MTTKAVQIDLWKLIAGLMGSGAFGGGVTIAAVQTSQAVMESRVTRIETDISELKMEIRAGLRELAANNLALAQSIARLEAISK